MAPLITQDALARIDTALGSLVLAMRLEAACHVNRLTPELLDRGVTVVTGGPGLRLPPPESNSKEVLLDGLHNLKILALGGSAIVIDQALNELFGPKKPYDNSNLGNARAILYMFRCGFAHEQHFPRWSVKPKYKREFEVALLDGQKMKFDARNLDGSGIKPEQFGGLEAYIGLTRLCRSLAKEKLAPQLA